MTRWPSHVNLTSPRPQRYKLGRTMLTRLSFALLVATVTLGAVAQDSVQYPNRSIRLVVPNTAGGAIDVVARLIGPKLAIELGQPIVIDNRVAAGGTVATNHVAQSAADGYTLLMVFDSFATNHLLFKGAQYDPVKDFAPIAMITRNPQLLVVHQDLPVRDLKGFIALAKDKGANLNVATAGAGTSSRLTLELFKLSAGIDPVAVHYKGGQPALTDVAGGQVQAMIVTMSVAMPHIARGRLVPIAITSPKPTTLLPKVMPFADEFPGFEAQSWAGMLAPAATPRPIVEKIHAALMRVLNQPDTRERLGGQGAEIVASTPAEFGAVIQTETTKWTRVIRERQITLD
jgi:tripartite-type tricarboxylate transporter receptor subunit TctC